MSRKFSLLSLVIVVSVIVSAASHAQAARFNVAVFNFQMTSDTSDWQWLEKGLADQITTDFTSSKNITVVARDEMQVLANKYGWVPEMAQADSEKMKEIGEQLKIDYLVTGLIGVDDDNITITAEIVRVSDRKEMTRKVVSGKVGDVLNLQKKVSAELLSWFSGVPAEEILPQLPVWSRSIPAAKALYEGLHLYDEGRYAEAWLKFREASRSDPTYMEAYYWIGRMYYFMDRYEHARYAYEKFVYMDKTHPRIGDAIKEYIHTYEKLGAKSEDLLKLYEKFMTLYPDAAIYREVVEEGTVSNSVWLKTRTSQLLGDMGQYEQATLLASDAMRELVEEATEETWDGYGWTYHVSAANAYIYNLTTGKVLLPKGLADIYRGERAGTGIIRFEPGSNEVVYRRNVPAVHWTSQLKDGKTVYQTMFLWHWLIAPDGYVFKTVTIYPLMEGDDVHLGCCLHKDAFADGGHERVKQGSEAREQGFTITGIPRSGMLHMHFWVHPNDKFRDPKHKFLGCRIVAEFDKVEEHGSIDVYCTNVDKFLVDVDGYRGRGDMGRIGLVPPGEHTLTFSPFQPRYPYDIHKVKVNVEAGKTIEVVGTLPWKEDTPWRTWPSAVLVGRGYPAKSPFLQMSGCTPSIQADDDKVRVFWSYRGDLWWSSSDDGKNFSPPAVLPMPVSSGWIEENPLCLRDESGRYILAFQSDREGQHNKRTYICWSRDAVNWSRPAMVIDRTVYRFRIIQDNRGRFIWVDGTDNKVTVLASTDAYTWEKLAELPLEGQANCLSLLQRNDGKYELVVEETYHTSEDENVFVAETRSWRYLSNDGRTWSAPEAFVKFDYMSPSGRIHAFNVNGRTCVFCFSRNDFWGGRPLIRILREKEGGGWEQSEDMYGVTTTYADMQYHPRWGYMISWSLPITFQFPGQQNGPFLLCGKDIDGFFAAAAPDSSEADQKE